MMKMSIKVLGAGCAKCKSLESVVREVVEENAMYAEIIKVADVFQMIGFGARRTPSLVINDKLALHGQVPSKAELISIIKRYSND